MQVLIAEDEKVSAACLRGLLAAMGHEVRVANDGLEAWGMLEERHVPLLISDWNMPRLDGLTLCQRIRAQSAALYTYVILLTTNDGHANRMSGLHAGADDFLVKPVHPEELAVRLEIARRLLSVQERLQQKNALLAELASTDELTGLANRREFFRVLDSNLSFAKRQGAPLSLVLFDVDHFKKYNDSFGHAAGDATLRGVSETAREHCREHETIARYGGEEFAVILLGSDEEAARAVAERLRIAIAERPWPHRDVTASFGISTTCTHVMNVCQLVEQADAALYSSKHAGRNCVTHFNDRTDHLIHSVHLYRRGAVGCGASAVGSS
jgi:diguanylate cyclase (GGDEF)-like protein